MKRYKLKPQVKLVCLLIALVLLGTMEASNDIKTIIICGVSSCLIALLTLLEIYVDEKNET